MANALWQVVAAYAFALVGGWISTSLQLAHKPLCALISFAAGTFLGVTIFAILPESLGACSWWAAFLAFATGYALFFLISKHVHHVCPACAASHFDADATRHFSEIATALVVALAIHSTTDGLALGIQREALATDATKWSLFSALCIHKIPEGLALGSLLIGAGLRRSAALGWVAAVEATTLLGGVIGIFFSGEGFHFLAWVNYGARRRRVRVPGSTCRPRRDVEARKETSADQLFGGRRIDRASEYWLKNAGLVAGKGVEALVPSA